MVGWGVAWGRQREMEEDEREGEVEDRGGDG